jgi:hypothetical protein
MAAIILDFLAGGFTICFNEQFFDGQPSFRLAYQTDGAAVPWPGHLCLRQVQAGRATAAQQQRTFQRFGASSEIADFLVCNR